MGGWSFVAPRLRDLTQERLPVCRPGRQRQPRHRARTRSTTAEQRRTGRRPPSGPPFRIWSRQASARAGRRPHEQETDPMAVVSIKVPSPSASRSPKGAWPAGSSPTAPSSRPTSRCTSWRPTRPARSSTPRVAGNLEDPGRRGDDRRRRLRVVGTIDPDAPQPLLVAAPPSKPPPDSRPRPSRPAQRSEVVAGRLERGPTRRLPGQRTAGRRGHDAARAGGPAGRRPSRTSTPPGSRGPAEGVA